MFGKEFFPTPKEVVDKMVEGLGREGFRGRSRFSSGALSTYHILDPEGGKGDILDRIIDEHDARRENIYTCEIHPDLKFILQDKGYKVIGSDFLQYAGDYYFDLILMNPPFSNGDEHLLHAWNILREGQVRCLLNQETILNPFSERRKNLIKIIEDHGSYELLGPVFDTAERKTGVEVVLVSLKKVDTSKKFHFEFSSDNTESGLTDLNEQSFQSGVEVRDIINTMLGQYGKLKEVFIDYIKARKRLSFYADDLFGNISIHDIVKETIDPSIPKWYNNFISQIQQIIWSRVLSNTKVEKYMTHNVRQNFSKFLKHQSYLEFTRDHVEELIMMIFNNRLNILEDAIGEVFDIFTKYHEENRCHVEGWKSNSKFKINRKVILPNWVSYGTYSSQYDLKQYGDTFSTNYNYTSEYSDIDKVMNYLGGYNTCIGIYEVLKNHFYTMGKVYPGDKLDNQIESDHFKIKFFRKGTIHLYFKDEKLWNEFNYRACFGKNWLPEAEKRKEDKGKKRYHDPSPLIIEKEDMLSIPESVEIKEELVNQLNLFG